MLKQSQPPAVKTEQAPSPTQPTPPTIKSDPVQETRPTSVQEPQDDIYVNTQQIQQTVISPNRQQKEEENYQNISEIKAHQQQQLEQPVAQDEDEWQTEAEPQPELVGVKSPVSSPKSPKEIVTNENIYGNIDAIKANEAENGHQSTGNPAEQHQEEEIVLNPDDPGVTAIALYDYQAAAEDEISFDPDDVITHIDMVNLLQFNNISYHCS